jgi:hypothetical protein
VKTEPDAPPKVALVPVDSLNLFHKNPRRGDVEAIGESLQTSSQYRPIVVNVGTHTGRPNEVLAGNHTLMAARNIGWSRIQVTYVDVDDQDASRIVLADNGTHEQGTYDDRELVALLNSIDYGLEGTGYTDDYLRELTASLAELDMQEDEHGNGPGFGPGGQPEPEPEDEEPPDRGDLLALANLGWTEPVHETHHGQHWKLTRDGVEHDLFVVDVNRDWAVYAPHLTDGALFVPYPNAFLTGVEMAATTRLLLVQPRPVLAARLLDKHTSLFGDKSTRLVTA